MQEKYWRETKYKVEKGRLVPTDESRYLSGGSYLTAAITAEYYSKYIPKYVRGVTADLGCGFAPMYQYYKAYAQKVICIDWQNTLHKNRILDIECDLSREIPLKNESVDTVILSDVLEHISRPECLLQEIHRILTPKGALLLNVPFLYPEHEKPYDYFRYTEFFYRNMARELGYNLAALKKVGGEREVIVTLAGKYMLKHLGNGSSGLVRRINRYAYHKWKAAGKSGRSDTCLGYFAVLTKKSEKGSEI